MRLGRRRLALGVCLMVGGLCGSVIDAQTVKPMAADAHPSFEVATVKPTDPTDQSQGYHSQGRELYIERETVLSMIMFAYGFHQRQVVDAPDWLGRTEWDVKGVPDVEGAPDLKQYQEIVRKLLEERFGLKTHVETRDQTVYALRVAKGGPKLVKNPTANATNEDQTGNGHMMKFTGNTMTDFTLALLYLVDRPVVDQTGLQGRYDFTLRWLPEGETSGDDQAAQPLFSAMPEQLGLKLEATKAPAPVLVVERVQRPEGN